MRRKLVAFLVVSALAGLAFVPAVAAAPPMAVSGDWSWSSSYVNPKNPGGNMFLVGTENSVWSGSFTGTSTDVLYVVIHRNMVVTARITVSFTGTVGTAEGTMVLEVTVLIAPDGSEGGTWVIKDGAGELAGIHGEGKWMAFAPFGTAGAYSGHVQW